VQGERSSEDELRRRLSSGPYPSRAIEENVADINAQVAANQTGVDLLLRLIDSHGLETVRAYMGHIQEAAAKSMRRALRKLPEGEHVFEDSLDNGARIAVRIRIKHAGEEGTAEVDFSGTSPVLPDNLNANPAIVRSAVLYCFRCLIEDDIPLNDGVLAPVSIHIPPGCLLNPVPSEDPAQCPAVVGGNVETSQRVVDVVFGALGVVAASQGTMNNFLFGRPTTSERAGFGYYETIAGGAGAGPGFRGADAVHTHMTNTRITDPEVLEDRYPVRVREFAIRRGSGGTGRQPGGAGICREIEFLEPLTVSLLTNRRRTRPYGILGGEPGAAGRNLLIRAEETTAQELPPSTSFDVRAGDRLRIETPGGGGCG
jgi:5-oxoprolinase (ATP-hydrolysing)